jgi:hypothetical protein
MPRIQVTLKKYDLSCYDVGDRRHWLNRMFPIGRNERYFVAIWTLIRNRVMPSSMNNEIASLRVQLLLCNARDLSVERFSRRGSG